MLDGLGVGCLEGEGVFRWRDPAGGWGVLTWGVGWGVLWRKVQEFLIG